MTEAQDAARSVPDGAGHGTSPCPKPIGLDSELVCQAFGKGHEGDASIGEPVTGLGPHMSERPALLVPLEPKQDELAAVTMEDQWLQFRG